MIADQINRDNLTEGESLAYLRHLPQMSSIRVQRTIEAVPAGETDVNLLDMEKKAPVLMIERLVMIEGGAPLEFLQARYRGDLFKYQLKF
jgi:DNA-binding GntR family transcriptional regulator